MSNIERWKVIEGYEGYYEVSNHGRVKSLKRVVRRGVGTTKRIKERIRKLGYGVNGFHVTLKRYNITLTVSVHRAVLIAFVGPCPEGMEACHYDGNHKNNHLENLRWDTRQANIDDRGMHGKNPRGERQGRSKLTNSEVLEIRKRLAYGEKQITLAKEFNVCASNISRIFTRGGWSHI